jgi:hypothetical protein
MAVIPYVIPYPGISADRAARTIIASWTGAADISSKSTVVSLIHRTDGLLGDAFVVDLWTKLNSGTVSGGAFTVELSWDGIHWLDSGADPVTVPTGDSVVAVIPLSIYAEPKESVISKLPARFVRLNLSTAVTVTGAPSFEAGLTMR